MPFTTCHPAVVFVFPAGSGYQTILHLRSPAAPARETWSISKMMYEDQLLPSVAKRIRRIFPGFLPSEIRTALPPYSRRYHYKNRCPRPSMALPGNAPSFDAQVRLPSSPSQSRERNVLSAMTAFQAPEAALFFILDADIFRQFSICPDIRPSSATRAAACCFPRGDGRSTFPVLPGTAPSLYKADAAIRGRPFGYQAILVCDASRSSRAC